MKRTLTAAASLTAAALLLTGCAASHAGATAQHTASSSPTPTVDPNLAACMDFAAANNAWISVEADPNNTQQQITAARAAFPTALATAAGEGNGDIGEQMRTLATNLPSNLSLLLPFIASINSNDTEFAAYWNGIDVLKTQCATAGSSAQFDVVVRN